MLPTLSLCIHTGTWHNQQRRSERDSSYNRWRFHRQHPSCLPWRFGCCYSHWCLGTSTIVQMDPTGNEIIQDDSLTMYVFQMFWLLVLLLKSGRIEDSEMRRTFNLGIGMVLVVSPEAASRILGEAKNGDYVAYRIGEVVDGEGVTYH